MIAFAFSDGGVLSGEVLLDRERSRVLSGPIIFGNVRKLGAAAEVRRIRSGKVPTGKGIGGG